MRSCLVIAILLSASCREAEHDSAPHYILDDKDIIRLDNQSIDLASTGIPPDTLTKAFNSSALIVTAAASDKKKSMRFCSGTLIAPEEGSVLPRIVTNQHCFAKKNSEGEALGTIIENICDKTHAYFSFSRQKEPIAKKCLPGSLKVSVVADLAIFTLKSSFDDDQIENYRPMKIWEGAVPVGRRAFIVHYPCIEVDGVCCFDKPNACTQAQQQQLESTEMLMLTDVGAKFPKLAITASDCYVLGGFDKALWANKPTLALGLRHRCDLVQGSSGSGLIDVETGALLGVNWGGVTIAEKYQYNIASSSSYLREFIDTGKVTPPETRRGLTSGQCGTIGSPFNYLTTILLLSPLLAWQATWRRRR
ncbi:MAG: trypsin-like peptidase domain-containing protein [Pseudomonadota bacterium]|nr:trypsin-like peptidase domain-containing protein [Pseudomonadota bacterium]